MIVAQQVSFAGGVWSPRLDARGDVAKYTEACRVMDNFIPLPQGGAIKRPGMEYRGKFNGTPTDGRLVEFEMKGESSIILAIAGGKMRFFKNGSPIMDTSPTPQPLEINAPWEDGKLMLLRWKMINDIMMFVHPDVRPKILTRISDTNWDLSNFVGYKNTPLLPENLDTSIRVRASFASYQRNTGAPAWASGTTYNPGDRVRRSIAGKIVFFNCEFAHTSSGANQPEDKTTYHDPDEDESRLLWTREFTDPSSTKGQPLTLISNKSIFKPEHVGAVWQLAYKRGLWGYEARLPVSKSAKGSNQVTSKVLVVQGRWTMQTFGNWAGKFHVQISRDKGKTWKSLRAVQSSKATPRNASFEGHEDDRALLRLMFTGYGANGTSGSPYAILNVYGGYVRGLVRILAYTTAKSVTAACITPVEDDITSVWAEGAWSDYQGYPQCIEFHQNRVVMAATKRQPHMIWGSADDDYTNFVRGTLATDPWAHQVMIGQREPIAWLLSDRQLIIGSAVGEFVMYGANPDSPITPEDRNMVRHSSCGCHVNGPGVLAADSAAIFVQHGGRIVREMAYRYESDRYEAANLNLLADHLFKVGAVTDFAIQRQPSQIIWFVAGGKLFSLTYERQQGIAAWAAHPTNGTVVSVACIRKSLEDEVWFIVNRFGTYTVERLWGGHMTEPQDNGRWSDCSQIITSPYSLSGHLLSGKTCVGFQGGKAFGPATLNSAFFAGKSGSIVIGLPYSAVLQPMTPVLQLQNGASRTREIRIHQAVPNVWRSRGGRVCETPASTKSDPLRMGPVTGVFSGEVPHDFDGRHSTSGDFTLISDEPYPFYIRSLTLKFNVHGDAG